MNEPKDALNLILAGLIGGLCGVGLVHVFAIWTGNPGIEMLWGGGF